MKAEYKKIFESMTISDWIWNHQRNIHFKMKYKGINIQKNPCDLWIYQEIINDIQPDLIIEIGSAGGGTALWMADILELLGRGKIISIDKSHCGFMAKHNRITMITGYSQEKTVIEKVYKLCESKKKIIVIHDGWHEKKQIKTDFKNYSDLVNVGSYFIIEDGLIDVFGWKNIIGEENDSGLLAALDIVKENNNFVIDKEKERYIITYNPCGYLKRVK